MGHVGGDRPHHQPEDLHELRLACYEGDSKASAPQPGYDSANLKICEDLYAQPGAVTAPYVAYKHNAPIITNDACPNGGSSISGTTRDGAGGYWSREDQAGHRADSHHPQHQAIAVPSQSSTRSIGTPDRRAAAQERRKPA